LKSKRLVTIAISVLSVFFFFPSLAAGEASLGIYGGIASPSDNKLEVRGRKKRPDWDENFTVGTRLAYWFVDEKYSLNAAWFGLALDLSYFQTESKNFDTDVYVVPITGLFMFRYPGKFLQPYVGVGGGFFFSYADGADLSSVGLGSVNYGDESRDFGFDARAGLALKFEKVSIFGEGRYTYFEPHYKDKVSGIDVHKSTDFEVYHLVLGLAYHF
jgi:hypothetical protein